MNLIEQTLKSRDYELLEEIGQGSFASVYKALNKKTNDFVAIKKIFKREKYDDIFKREIEIMQKVNDEHSLKFIEFFEDEKNYYLILELCDTDLNAYINFRNKGLEIDAIKNNGIILTNRSFSEKSNSLMLSQYPVSGIHMQ